MSDAALLLIVPVSIAPVAVTRTGNGNGLEKDVRNGDSGIRVAHH